MRSPRAAKRRQVVAMGASPWSSERDGVVSPEGTAGNRSRECLSPRWGFLPMIWLPATGSRPWLQPVVPLGLMRRSHV